MKTIIQILAHISALGLAFISILIATNHPQGATYLLLLSIYLHLLNKDDEQ
jgi:hypothetical protein